MTEHSRILGFRVAKLTMAESVARVLELVAQRKGQIVTANPEILYAGRGDRRLAQVLDSAELVTADGVGVLLASHILGDPVPERVTGVALTHALASASVERGLSWYLLGAAPGVAERAAEKLREMYPGLLIAGSHHGYFGDDENKKIVEFINRVRPDLILVAMGLRQEFWIADHKGNLPCPAMGVGGVFDILAGVTTRAPMWMQRMGLEWMHRLYREPRRFWRMLALPKFVGAVILERLVE
jgi:N-acetylglucosaminyldiphosphoundecaprenol N-acetyl-beta-D-mannosaminyltransferase